MVSGVIDQLSYHKSATNPINPLLLLVKSAFSHGLPVALIMNTTWSIGIADDNSNRWVIPTDRYKWL